ncbi:unnamed protein product [Owenia fusiformis]|uniref:Uncharacterized protein n=1 Tax=Owenia fusiformis TaxID=6347 RepID=A0A8J1U7L5_OWEFU|nr:unnamed protein product [Owenia fusiformis]
MSNSGVNLTDDGLEAFLEIKQKKKLSYVMYKISDDKRWIEVESKVPKGTEDCATAWNNLKEVLKKDEGRYVVFDANWTSDSGGFKEKLIFVAWNPDDSSAKNKMLYSSSKDNILKKFGDTHKIQANDFDDLEFTYIFADLKKKYK